MTRLGQEARWLGQEVGKLRDVEVVTKAGAMADKVVDAPDRQRTPRELARMIAFSLAVGQRQLISGPE